MMPRCTDCKKPISAAEGCYSGVYTGKCWMCHEYSERVRLGVNLDVDEEDDD